MGVESQWVSQTQPAKGEGSREWQSKKFPTLVCMRKQIKKGKNEVSALFLPRFLVTSQGASPEDGRRYKPD